MAETTDDGFELEVAAIGQVLSALGSLTGAARERVLDYVTRALGINLGRAAPARTGLSVIADPPVVGGTPAASNPTTTQPVTDIRSLKDAKQPSSANQMAALVAYYLAELAPEGERRDVIDASDLERFFKQAGYPLPQRVSMTLPNAASSGYFDATGESGKYKLNPVGHNLVAHSLPTGSDTAPRRRRAKKTTAKKATAKKATAKKATAKKATAKKATAKKATAKKATAKKATAKRVSGRSTAITTPSP